MRREVKRARKWNKKHAAEIEAGKKAKRGVVVEHVYKNVKKRAPFLSDALLSKHIGMCTHGEKVERIEGAFDVSISTKM